jgi:hypothetical protein
MDQRSQSSPDASSVLFWSFVVISCGLVATTIASNLGADAIRTLMLTVLIATFVAAGGLLGMLVMQHLGRTHLPDESEEADQSVSLFADSDRILRGKGFRGLFSASEEASTTETNSLRRTA